MKEVIEMAQVLLAMKPDTYMKCKYILLIVSAEHQGTNNFMKKLFSLTDEQRPLLIEMKEPGSRAADREGRKLGVSKNKSIV